MNAAIVVALLFGNPGGEQELAAALKTLDVAVVSAPGEGPPLQRAAAAGATHVVVGELHLQDRGAVGPTPVRGASARFALRVLDVASGRPVGVLNTSRPGFGPAIDGARADALAEAAREVALRLKALLPDPASARGPAVQAGRRLVRLHGARTFDLVDAVEAACRASDPGAKLVALGPGVVTFEVLAQANPSPLVAALNALPAPGYSVAAGVEAGVIVIRLEEQSPDPEPHIPPDAEDAPP